VTAVAASAPHGGGEQDTVRPDANVRPAGAPADAVPNLLRTVMRHHAKGIAIVTAGVEAPVGFCVSSLVSLSLQPPLVSFTVGVRTASWPTVRCARRVVAHLLDERQEDLAHRFARSGGDKFGPQTHWHRDAAGLPVLDGVLAWLAVVPVSHLPVGDHMLVIGQVVAAEDTGNGAPLIHHNGRFARLADDGR
jgi:flavin reductase (DIM6/NTAB) family NADH-FMN oxidoreductase RutF